MDNWLEVDREGLTGLRAGVPKISAVWELLSNSLDAGATEISIALERSDPVRRALRVEDNAERGWTRLSDAYTIFSRTDKRRDPTKRGRFTFGVKLVLALCDSARVQTNVGTVLFDGTGRRTTPETRTRGTEFTGTIPMTDEEASSIAKALRTVLLPPGVRLYVSLGVKGVEVPHRTPIRVIDALLPAPAEDEDGILRTIDRRTIIEVHEPLAGEKPSVYEMGIPVCATGDRFHYNILQRVPLTMERTALAPEYLQQVRTLVAEHCLDLLDQTTVSMRWVEDAMAHPDASKELVQTAFHLRFGENAVVQDPNDPDATRKARDEGRPVVMGRDLPKGVWDSIRRHDVAQTAGRVFGTPVEEVDSAHWTPSMHSAAETICAIARLVGAPYPEVVYRNDPHHRSPVRAERDRIHINLSVIPPGWLETVTEETPLSQIMQALIHVGRREVPIPVFAARLYRSVCKEAS